MWTPLNAILGFAQIRRMDSLTPEQTEALHPDGGVCLLHLINDVMDITRMAGRLHATSS